MSSIVVEEKLYLIKTKRSPYWYAMYRESNNKNEIRRSTKTTDKSKAWNFAMRMKMEIEIKSDAGILFTTKNTFAKYSKLAIAAMESDPKPKSIFEAYTSVLKRCVAPYFSNKDIKTIKYREFMIYFDQLGEMSLTQIRNRQGALKRVFIEAIKDGSVEAIPIMPKKESKRKEVRDPITHEDKILLEHNYSDFIANSRKELTRRTREVFLWYMRFLANTGVRSGEEMKFNFSDIEIKERKTWVVISKGKVKNSKKAKRKVRLNPKAIEALKKVAELNGLLPNLKLLRKHDVIAFSIDGKVPNFLLAFKQLKEFVKFSDDKKTLYSFRHTYITEALSAGLPIMDVATQCGTSAEMIEQHYNHLLTDNDKFEKVQFQLVKDSEQFEPMDNVKLMWEPEVSK